MGLCIGPPITLVSHLHAMAPLVLLLLVPLALAQTRQEIYEVAADFMDANPIIHIRIINGETNPCGKGVVPGYCTCTGGGKVDNPAGYGNRCLSGNPDTCF